MEAVTQLVTCHQAEGQLSKYGFLLVYKENSFVAITTCLVITEFLVSRKSQHQS